MLAAVADGFALFLNAEVLLLCVLAVFVGLLLGVLPGLGGLTALALLLPFIYGMEPMAGLGFLLAAHAVVYTGGALTSIALGIPGSGPNAATVIDGYPMTRAGKGGIALGAAFASSGLGGVIGVIALVGLLPFLQPIVFHIGSPETFLFAVMGIIYVGVLGERSMARGLIAGGLGVFIALFGYDRLQGVPRFWLGIDYLLDGIRLVPLVLGLFAVPEILDLALGRRAESPVTGSRDRFAQIGQGMKATILRPYLLIKSSLLGVFIGIVPGVGGDTAPFVAYASAKQTSPTPEAFGSGCIEGVIAPEASNNAKEGGALVTTLALGIPGSAGMSVLLGGFLLLGLEPGPDFLAHHMDLAVGLAIVLAFANLIAVVIMIAASPLLLKIADLRPQLLAPILAVLVVLGAYAYQNEPLDVVATFVIGGLGCAMKAMGYSRPALVLGFVMAPLIETYLHITLQAYGMSFLLRPGSLALLALIVMGLSWGRLRRYFLAAAARYGGNGNAKR